MTVPLKNLGGDVGRIDTQLPAHIVLDKWRNVGKIADSTAHLARLDSGCSEFETLYIALHLLVPERPLQAERSDVSVHTVGSANARG